MNPDIEPTSILSDDKMQLQYGLISNLQNHFYCRLKHWDTPGTIWQKVLRQAQLFVNLFVLFQDNIT